jgi:GxxExxY protein
MGRVDLLHEELTYTIRGILYKIHNYLGSYRNEKQYCDAIAYGLKVKSINFEKEKILPISFPGELKGRNRLDFLIENKIILEIKTVPRISRNDYYQCMRYLVSSGKQLCLLVNFYPDNLQIKRILNPNFLNKNP